MGSLGSIFCNSEEMGLQKPFCCWNASGAPFFSILASLFLNFCVALRYKEQLFNKKTNKGGSRKELKIISKRTPKMRSILGGELLGSTFLLQLTRKHSLVGSPPPKRGRGIFTPLAVFWALNPARTHFAAGTLLDVHFSLFWRHCSCISV